MKSPHRRFLRKLPKNRKHLGHGVDRFIQLRELRYLHFGVTIVPPPKLGAYNGNSVSQFLGVWRSAVAALNDMVMMIRGGFLILHTHTVR